MTRFWPLGIQVSSLISRLDGQQPDAGLFVVFVSNASVVFVFFFLFVFFGFGLGRDVGDVFAVPRPRKALNVALSFRTHGRLATTAVHQIDLLFVAAAV